MSLRGLGIAAILLIGTASAADTCLTGDHPNCPYWVANGFCTAYPATKGQSCARACGMCKPAPAACSDASERCPVWVSRGFCTSTYDRAYKAANCAKSCDLCSPPVPTTNCAIVYNDQDAIVMDFNAPPMTDYPIGFEYVPPRTLKEALVKTGCTLKLSTGPSTTTGAVGTITGGAAKQAIPTGYTAAMTASCTCP